MASARSRRSWAPPGAPILPELGFLPPVTDAVFVDQSVLEVAVDLDFAAPVAASACLGGGVIASASDPADGPALASATAPLVWIILHVDSGDYVFAYDTLNDPATYYGGQKLGRILTMSEITRTASDDAGGVIASRLDVTFLDHDGTFRLRENSETLRYRMAEVFLADDATRLSAGVARRIGFYTIDDYRANADLSFTISFVDLLGSDISSYRANAVTPPWSYDRTIPGFEQLPAASIGKPVPVWYGSVSDESLPDSATGAPVLTSAGARGGYLDGGVFQIVGFGDLSPAAAVSRPASVALAPGGAGAISAAVPDSTYGVWAQAQDAAGAWTDPTPFYANKDNGGTRGTFQAGMPTAIADGSHTLVATCGAVTGAVRYRFTLFYYYFGARPLQALESASPSVTFIDSPDFPIEPDTSNITAGASVPAARRRYYTVKARMSDGLTGASNMATFGGLVPRPAEPEVVPVVGALEYWWYASDVGPGEPGFAYARLWKTTDPFLIDTFDDVGVTFVDPSGDQGAIGFTFTGTELIGGVSYDRWVAGAGAISFQSLFGSDLGSPTPTRVKLDASVYGSTVLCAGQPGWPFAQVYRTFGGRWYSVVYLLTGSPIAAAALDGTVPLGANICGLKENADGTGRTISSLVDQVVHYLNNFLLPKTAWQSGDWFPILTENGIPLISTASAAAVKTAWEAIIDGGLLGAWGIGADGSTVTTDDFIRIAARNLGVKIVSTHHGQIRMFLVDPTASAVATFDDQADILLAPAPTFTPNSTQFANVGTWQFAKVYLPPVTNPTPATGALLPPANATTQDWLSGTLTFTHDVSIAAHKGVQKPLAFTFELHRDGTAPRILVTRTINLLAFPRQRYVWTTKLQGYDRQHGDLVLFTHYAGPTSGGDVNRKIVIDAIGLNPHVGASNPNTAFDVTLEGIDVTGLTL